MSGIRRARARTAILVSVVITLCALGGVVGKVWGAVLRGRARPVALVPGPGVTPFVQGLLDTIHLAYLPGYRIPVVKTLGAWELTFHGDDANEAENVALCVQALDGVVVPPGAVFSYNDTVGERTEERGFRPGLMYVSGQVVTGMGGGVCIPSTALYNAALRADMEIVERYSHSGPVSYASPGLDAAVVYGMKDLRFRNTSDAPVVLHAAVLGNILSIGISGRPAPGRRVVVERDAFMPLPFEEVETPDPTIPEGQPSVKQEGRAGWTATVVRTVYQGKRVLRRETVSRDAVAPRARILLVNPLDIPDSPEAKAAAEAALVGAETAVPSANGNAAPPVKAEPAETPRVEALPPARDARPAPRPSEPEKKEAAPPAATKPAEHAAAAAGTTGERAPAAGTTGERAPAAPATPAHSDS